MHDRIVRACRKAWEAAGRGRILLGVSGGPDSVSLFLAFHIAKIPFEVAHCNFNLRGEESLRDREFVTGLCNRFGVSLHIADFNVTALSFKGESVEMACRRLRYGFFRDLKGKEGFSRVAVGHNADDNAETFFLNALRGSGTRGLKGMEPDTGAVIRPLLGFRRHEILDFLELNGQSFITDSSNMESDHYRRNFLRNKVFPMLESKWEGFHKAVATTIEIQKGENRIVEHFTSMALKDVEDVLPWETIKNFPDPGTLIYRFICRFGGSPTIAGEMAESIKSPVPGKTWLLDNGFKARFTRKGIKIGQDKAEPSGEPIYVWDKLEGDRIDLMIVKSAPLSEIYLPFGQENYEWQLAMKGMKIKSLGLKGSQDVWKVLKDAGMSPSERSSFAILVDKESGEPIWLPGIKRSRLHLISPEHREIYRVHK